MTATIGTDLAKAEQFLKQGKPVAIPTETVYGLAANALDPIAVTRIFEVKNRPFFDPLIVHVCSFEAIYQYASSIPAAAIRLVEAFWPGPLTLLLPKNPIIPDIVTSGLDTVGLRMPDHPLTLELLKKLPFPLAAPSANPFGYISPTTARHVADQLGDVIEYIMDGGPCKVGIESTIIGFESELLIVYRLGGIPTETLESISGRRVSLRLNTSENPTAPGQLSSHYAPRKPLLLGDITELLERYKHKRIALISFSDFYKHPSIIAQWKLSATRSLAEAACNLFSTLRDADNSTADMILAETVPDSGLGRAINDRLRRAAA